MLAPVSIMASLPLARLVGAGLEGLAARVWRMVLGYVGQAWRCRRRRRGWGSRGSRRGRSSRRVLSSRR